jgi:hypothetical protein
MLEIDPATLFANVANVLARNPQREEDIPHGHAAAVETVLLMDRARKRLSPMAIIDADDPKLGPKPRAKKLWADQTIAQATAASLADSIQVLARIWQAAWARGRGKGAKAIGIRECSEDELQKLYRSSSFLVPMTLAEMVQSGNFEAAGVTGRRAVAAPHAATNGGKRRQAAAKTLKPKKASARKNGAHARAR